MSSEVNYVGQSRWVILCGLDQCFKFRSVLTQVHLENAEGVTLIRHCSVHLFVSAKHPASVCVGVSLCVYHVPHLRQWRFVGNLDSKFRYDANDAVGLLKSSYAGYLRHRSSRRSLVVTVTTVLLPTLAHVQV